MSLSNLLSVLSAPSRPSEVPLNPDWRTVETEIGTDLPDDYKEFIERFGTGVIDGFICILNPFSRNPHLKLQTKIPIYLDALRQLSATEVIPFPLFPDPGGILPFGGTDNGDCLFWRRSGERGNWPIVLNESRGPDWEVFNLSMTDFIAAILKRERTCGIFPRQFPTSNPSFGVTNSTL